MKCPFCGYPKAEFKTSRRNRWKGRTTPDRSGALEPRKDLKAHCRKCGKEWVEDR